MRAVLWLCLALAAFARGDIQAAAEVEALLSDDPELQRSATRELLNLGARSVEDLRLALARDLRPAQRRRVDDLLQTLIGDLLVDLQTAGRQAMTVLDADILQDSLEVNVDDDRPSHWPSLLDSDYVAARDSFLGVGLVGIEALLDPMRWVGSGEQELQGIVYARLEPVFWAAVASDSGRAAVRARILAEGALTAPWLGLAAGAPPGLQPWFEEVRAALAAQVVAGLTHPDSATRDLARDQAFRLDALVLPELEAADSYEARAMLQRVRFGVSDALYHKIGHSFQGYHDLPAAERRALVDAATRLGGNDAIRCLRKLLDSEAEMSIRLLAATGLVRLGDDSAIAFIEQMGMAELLQIPQVTTAIYMDQGIKYLKIQKYARAAAEFQKILKLDPENEVAHYNLACAWSLDGRLEEAVASLRRSIELGYDDLEHIESDTDLDNIRQTDGYRTLIEGLRAAE